MIFRLLLLFFGLTIAAVACAESGTKPAPTPFKTIRYQEDYSHLKDSKQQQDFWDGLKYIELPFLENSYFSLGGELRERYQNLHGYEFGLQKFKNDDYLLQRVLLHGDLHLGRHFRAFVQFGSHYVFGKANEKTQVEENHFDLQQGFLEMLFPLANNQFMLRGGRQEMSFGSDRLVSVRNNPNIRRSFDAVRIGLLGKSISVDAFYAVPLELRQGVLDDRHNDGQSFWGIYSVLTKPVINNGPSMDFYYLGRDQAGLQYTQGEANEHRHTVGTRLWRKLDNWDYNFEFAYQFGDFGKGTISAWTAASDTGYRWEDVPLNPRLGLKMDIVSGDDNPKDNTLKTFNALYPKLAYFSENALVVPANLYNVYPYVSVEFNDDIELSLGWDFFWRYSTKDAFYVNPFRPLEGTELSSERYIGSELTLDANWRVSRNIQLNTAYVHLFRSRLLQSVKAEEVDFFMLMASYRF